MKKSLLIILVALLQFGFHSGQGQSADEVAVRKTIDQLFKGMYLGDSSLVRSVFMKDVTLATIARDKMNNPLLLKENTVDQFVTAVGQPHEQPWVEKIWNVTVQVDGDFAQVWCDYAFYIGKQFSHCGVDAFHLFKSEGEWLIFHLADTRRKQNCAIPEEVRKEME